MKTRSFLLSACAMLAMALAFSCSTTIEGDGNSANSNGGNPGSSSSNINPSVIPKIKIVNGTGYTIYYMYIKPSISTEWGRDLASPTISDGESREIMLSHPLSTYNEYDIRLQVSGSSGNIFTKYKFPVSNGMTVTFNSGDLTYESDFPSITIQNRTGASFNSIYVRPSSVPNTDTTWGRNYGSLSNNNDESISIPIPPSSYTEFDVQVKSSNPTATYTKRVTVSNGTIVRYTRTDSDTPLTGQPVIVFENNTGYTVSYMYIKPSTSTNWGSDVGTSLQDGQSRTYTSQSLSASNEYDIRWGTSSNIDNGNQFVKYKFTISDGMIIPFSVSDLTDGSNFPSITIRNRTGAGFNSIYVRPSSMPSTDTAWGRNYGSLSNNNDESISIPIPPSSYTEFDVQVKSSNPTATYTERMVSNGDTITYTRANSDTPLSGLPVIVIQNNTGYTLSYMYIRQSTSTSWGSDVGTSFPDGQLRTYSLSQSLSTGSIDIRLGASSNIDNGNQFVKYNVPVLDGMIVTLTGSDLYTPE